METKYSSPVNQLLTLGKPHGVGPWRDYLTPGLNREHVPELIRMATDEELSYVSSDSLTVWAPVHAWRALAQLRAVEAVVPLIGELYRIDDNDDDWISEDFPDVFAMIGPPAIASLAEYLAAPGHGVFADVCAGRSLEKIGNAHPERRERCIEILTEQLRRYAQNDPMLNGFLVSDLLDLHAVESLDVIRDAFNQDCVDISILGDLEDAEIELGVRMQRATPPPRMFPWLFDPLPPLYSASMMRTSPKVGRNDPCPCGSGKKYKKCCLQK